MNNLTRTVNFWILLILTGAFALTGCGQSDSGETAETAELTISLTDAEGDFNQYTVDVVSLRLHKANAAVVETLPNRVRLDFSQYIEVTEFVSTATVPVGFYEKAEITLDYANAEITVEDANGNSLPAQALDEHGQPLQTLTVEIMLNAHSGFRILPGIPASLVLDFDLEASNEVVINGSSATIRVNPVLLASTDLEDDKSRRLRGLLAGVRPDAGTFAVNLRPFRVRHREYGRVIAHTNPETVFEIDGVAYRQQEGLEVLSRKAGPTPVVALGSLSLPRRMFVAQQVYAGSSVPWGNQDALRGSVISRRGNSLTVLGATIELDDGRYRFNDEIRVIVDARTRITRQGDPGNGLGIDALSVGQQVNVLGRLSDDGTTLDASGNRGLVRMRYSQVSGLVARVSPLEVDLQHINRRLVGRYDFTGTGIDLEHDADPEHYQVDTGGLTLASLGLAEPVRVRGFPTAFGSAPLDFEAKTVIDLSELPTSMLMSYGADGSETAIASLDENGMLLDLSSAAGRHHLKQAGVITDIATLPAVPLIEPAGAGGLYAISQGRRVHVYLEWNDYQRALVEHLARGQRVVFVIAKGDYDAAGLRLSARRVVTRTTD